MINLISDTVTKPTPGMLEAMFSAEVGDDVFGTDPSVSALEAYVCELFGHEAAVFCPSGTMTNQLAIKVHTHPLDEVICDHDSHIWQYESAGFAWHSGVRVNPLPGERGKLRAAQIEDAIQPTFDWLARTRLVVLENTCNRGGGSVYRLNEVDPIRELCDKHGLSLHLDGARLMNALAVTDEATEEWGRRFDTISLCLSKGVGAPVGSVLSGGSDQIRLARRFRKVMGGGMRQAGYLAAGALYGLRHQLVRLKDDHARAQRLGVALEDCAYVERVRPVESNIVMVDLTQQYLAADVLSSWREAGLAASGFGKRTIRLVTHLDVDDAAISQAVRIMQETQLQAA